MKRLLIITSLALALAACGGSERENMFKDFSNTEGLCVGYSLAPDELVEAVREDHDYAQFNADDIRHDLAEVCS